MDTRVDHRSSVRLIASFLSRELVGLEDGDRSAGMNGVHAFFRLHSAWRSGIYRWNAEDRVLQTVCERVFASCPEDREAFVRGIRSVAGIVVDDDRGVPATASDRDVFWSCIGALSAETGVTMPSRPPERGVPVLRGH